MMEPLPWSGSAPVLERYPMAVWNESPETRFEKQLHPYYGVVSSTYYAMTGMPWLASDGRKAVKTEWFWQPIRGQPRRVDTNELRKYANTVWIQSIVMTIIKQVCTIPWDIVPIDEETPYEQVEEEIKSVKEFFDFPNKNGETWSDIMAALVKDVLEIDAGVLVKTYTIDSYDFEHLEARSGAPLLKPLVCPECGGSKITGPRLAKEKAWRTLDAIADKIDSLPDVYTFKIAAQEKDTYEIAERELTKPDYSPVIKKMLEITSQTENNDVPGLGCPFCNGTGRGRQMTEVYVQDGACLKFGEMVETDKGFIPIGKIVNEKIACNVKSYNQSTKEIEWKPITNWFNNGITTDWMRIKAKTNRKFRSLTCTPNHNVLTPDGYKKAEELELGETIYTQQEALSKDQWQIVLGSILGDASLSKGQTAHAKIKLSETHSAKQKEYLLWKAEMLKPLGIRLDDFLSRYDEEHELREKIRMQTSASIVFEEFYPLKYPAVKPEIIDKMEELGLAVWIQDDGCLAKKGQLLISCGKIEMPILEKIAEKLNKKFGTYFVAKRASRENILYLDRTNYCALSKRIAKYFHPSMQYKTTEEAGSALPLLDQKLRLEIVETEIFEKSRYEYYDARYDIEVVDNHNFFAQGMLVSNSFLKDCDRTGYTIGYWQYSYAIPAHPMWFNKEEIIYYSANPRGQGVYGYSPMQSSLEAVKVLEYSMKHNMTLFVDGAVPDGVLSLEDMDDAEMKRMKITWENEMKGQSHKVVFMNKKSTFTPFAFNNRDMQFLEGQKETWKQVMANFGVSPTDLGMAEDASRATAGTSAELGRRKAIRPIVSKLEELINEQLLPELGGLNVRFKFTVDDPVEERMKAELSQLYITMGVKSINEVRIEMGLPPMEGGDGIHNEASQFLDQLGLGGKPEGKPVGEGKPAEQEGIEDTQQETEDGPKDVAGKQAQRPFAAQVPYRDDLRNVSAPFPYALPKEGHVNTQQPYRDLAGRCPGCGSVALYQVGAAPDEMHYGIAWACGSCNRTFTIDELRTGVAEQERLHSTGEKTDSFAKPVMASMDDILAPAENRGFNTAPTSPMPNAIPQDEDMRPRKSAELKKKVEHIGDFSFPVMLDQWLGFQSAPLYYFISEYLKVYDFEEVDATDAMKKKLTGIFAEAFTSGLNLRQIMQRIVGVGFEEDRAESIARTETIRIANEAKLLQMKANDYKKVIFTATTDAHTCDECKKLDGKTMGIRAAQGFIPRHVNCRCTWRAKVI
jgi:SPP1 gp7 family putative phage head morphogenesis protein